MCNRSSCMEILVCFFSLKFYDVYIKNYRNTFISGNIIKNNVINSVCGGLIGCLSSVIVIFSYRYSSSMHGTSFDLLVIRSACDFGIAIRFLFEPYIGDQVCGYRTCYINGFDDLNTSEKIDNCAFPTAVMEFFEISSEAWFLCLALEFSISLSDPFSTFKQR